MLNNFYYFSLARQKLINMKDDKYNLNLTKEKMGKYEQI